MKQRGEERAGRARKRARGHGARARGHGARARGQEGSKGQQLSTQAPCNCSCCKDVRPCAPRTSAYGAFSSSWNPGSLRANCATCTPSQPHRHPSQQQQRSRGRRRGRGRGRNLWDSSLHLRVLSVLSVLSLRFAFPLLFVRPSLSALSSARLDPRSPRISSVETFNPSSISAQSRARRRVGPCRVDERTRAYLAGGAARAPRVQLHRAAKAKQRVAQRRCHPSFLP